MRIFRMFEKWWGGERVFAISSACRRSRRIAATGGLSLRFIYNVYPSNPGGVGKAKAGDEPAFSLATTAVLKRQHASPQAHQGWFGCFSCSQALSGGVI
jgi:hypothetical protein